MMNSNFFPIFLATFVSILPVSVFAKESCEGQKSKLAALLSDPQAEKPKLKTESWDQIRQTAEAYIQILQGNVDPIQEFEKNKKPSLDEVKAFFQQNLGSLHCLPDSTKFFRALATSYGSETDSSRKQESRSLYLTWLKAPLEASVLLPVASRLTSASHGIETKLLSVTPAQEKSLAQLREDFKKTTDQFQKEMKSLIPDLTQETMPETFDAAKAKSVIQKEARLAREFQRKLNTWLNKLR